MNKPRTPRDKSREGTEERRAQCEILEDALITCAVNDGECGGDAVEDYLSGTARNTLINDLAAALESMGYELAHIQPTVSQPTVS